jgi:hypothetical protein
MGLWLIGIAGPVAANAPDNSLRPEVRPLPDSIETVAVDDAVASFDAGEHAPGQSLRPVLRPSSVGDVASAAAPEMPFGGLFTPLIPRQQRVLGGTELATALSLRPLARPEALIARIRAAEARAMAGDSPAETTEERAEATRQTPSRVAQTTVTRGRLCGIRGLVGDRLEPITGRIGGCGIAEPVRLREVDGVTLNQPATINCTTAEALQTWLREAAVPAVGRRGGGIASLRVVASYACRTRNSQAGARLSEHALGNAIDIAAITLQDGSAITVLQGWRDQQDGPILRAMHRGACGTFGTVLGPESDRFHQDHFHFDTAAYRSGAYCR